MPRLFVCLRCTFLLFREGFVAAGNRGLQLPAEREESCRDSAVSLDDGVL